MKSIFSWKNPILIALSFFLLAKNVYANAIKPPLTFSYSIIPIAISASLIIFLIVISSLMIRNIENGIHDDNDN